MVSCSNVARSHSTSKMTISFMKWVDLQLISWKLTSNLTKRTSNDNYPAIIWTNHNFWGSMRSLNIAARYQSQKTLITCSNLRLSLNYDSEKVSDISMITWTPLTSPETHYYTSLSLQEMGQTKSGHFHHFMDVGSWMGWMNYQDWKMNFEFWASFFLWAKIFAYPMFTQTFKKIEQKVAVI